MLPMVSRLLPLKALLAKEERGVCMSVMCSLMTDNVSFMTGESALKVCDRAEELGATEERDVRRAAVCASGDCCVLAELEGPDR